MKSIAKNVVIGTIIGALALCVASTGESVAEASRAVASNVVQDSDQYGGCYCCIVKLGGCAQMCCPR